MRFMSVLVLLAALMPAGASAAGFQREHTATSPPIEIGIWYPPHSPVVAAANVPFGQALAVDGEISGGNLPLVILSHGNQSRMDAHAHTALALAEAGYVAVALTHPGDNDQNRLTTGSDWLVSRPADISRTIDHMLSDWIHVDRIDRDRIGVYGYSLGGYTALAAAGAVVDIGLIAGYCATAEAEPTCPDNVLDLIDPAEFYPRLRGAVGDDDIAAVSIAAPGISFGFDRAALADVDVPVQIWSAALDEAVPHRSNGAVLAANLPQRPELHLVEDAGHFAFVGVCPPSVKTYDLHSWRLFCVDAEGFDRAAFHRRFHQGIVAFFDATLSR